MDIYTELAKNTIELYLNKQKLPDTKKLPIELLNKRAGCFVSIHQRSNDSLRGCIGTIRPMYKNLGSEIIANAIEAAFHDPRFPALTKGEIDDLKFSVDVLTEPELINSEKQLDPKKYGVIIKSLDNRTGLLLPDLEGVNDVRTQIQIAKEKAGILENEDVAFYRFMVNRHK